MNVNGTAPGAQGGFFRVRTDGNVNVTATIQAQNTAASGTARGGLIDLRGASISIAADLLALGTNERGGTVAINATVGDLIVSGPGQFNASASTSGDGGTIYLQAVGSVQVARRLRVLGVNSGHGGTIEIDGTTVGVTNDVVATGGTAGGDVMLQTGGGRLDVGTDSGSIVVDTSTGAGGNVNLFSRGNDIEIRASTRIDVSGIGSAGEAGTIDIAGATVAADAGSIIVADGPGGGQPGTITVQAREVMTLAGTLRANTGGPVTLIYRATTPTIGTGVVCPCDTIQDASLSPACGDGIVRLGVEDCDGSDLNGQTCASRGLPSGTLKCSSTCTFDTSGCTGS